MTGYLDLVKSVNKNKYMIEMNERDKSQLKFYGQPGKTGTLLLQISAVIIVSHTF